MTDNANTIPEAPRAAVEGLIDAYGKAERDAEHGCERASRPMFDRLLQRRDAACATLLSAFTAQDATIAALRRSLAELRVPADLAALSAKAHGGEWFVQHGATDDGLSRIDDGQVYGMFPIYGERHEIELAAAAVNHIRAALAAAQEPRT